KSLSTKRSDRQPPSRFTSVGVLSSRRPRNTGCRNFPSRVHCISAAPAALDRYLTALPDISLPQSLNSVTLVDTLNFAYNLAGRFIVTQPEEHRLAKFSIACPLGEFNLGDEFGIYPMHFLHHRRRDAFIPAPGGLRWKIDKRTIVPFFRA